MGRSPQTGFEGEAPKLAWGLCPQKSRLGTPPQTPCGAPPPKNPNWGSAPKNPIGAKPVWGLFPQKSRLGAKNPNWGSALKNPDLGLRLQNSCGGSAPNPVWETPFFNLISVAMKGAGASKNAGMLAVEGAGADENVCSGRCRCQQKCWQSKVPVPAKMLACWQSKVPVPTKMPAVKRVYCRHFRRHRHQFRRGVK